MSSGPREKLGLVAMFFAGVLAVAATTTSAEGPGAEPTLVPTLRFAFTSFDAPERLVADPGYQTVASFLGRAGRDPNQPLGFDLSVGNYYQVFDWLKRDLIDGALVSPFMATLLEQQGWARRVVEIPASTGSGRWPHVVASRNGRPKVHPLRDFEGFLRETEQVAAGRLYGFENRQPSRYEVRLVAHLSTTGFFLPVAYTQAWLDDRMERVRPWTPQRRLELERHFWQVFFERVRLTWVHNDQAEPSAGATITLTFTHGDRRFPESGPTGEPDPTWASACYDLAQARQEIEPFGVPLTTDCPEQPTVPNDVLVLSCRSLSALEPEATGCATAAAVLAARWRAKLVPPVLESSFAQRVQPSWQDLDRLVRQLWRGEGSGSSAVLAEYYRHWYEDGRFELSVADTLSFLRQDQRTSRLANAALVLPGGGVKSAYQARVLDFLYERSGEGPGKRPPLVENAGDPRRHATSETARGGSGPTLAIDHVVGTSGGAIMGLLAAQLGLAEKLSPRMDGLGEEEVAAGTLTEKWYAYLRSPGEVFPFFGLPRWLSVLVMWLIFNLVMGFAARFNNGLHEDHLHQAMPVRMPFPLALGTTALLVTAPIGLGLVFDPNQHRDSHLAAWWVVGLLVLAYLALGVSWGGVPHEGVPRVRPQGASSRSPRSTRWMLMALTAIGFGTLAVALLFHLELLGRNVPLSEQPAAVGTLVGWAERAVAAVLAPLSNGQRQVAFGMVFFLLQLGLLFTVRFGLPGARFHAGSRLPRALVLVALYLGLVHGLIAVAAALGQTTWLEATVTFWGVVVAASFTACGLILAFARSRSKGWQRHPREAIAFLTTLERRRYVLVTPAWSWWLTGLGTFLLWVFCLGHGLYSPTRARATLHQLAAATLEEREQRFTSTLVVTATALGGGDGRQCSSGLEPGDYYFCFAGPPGWPCPQRVNNRWRSIEAATLEELVAPVFASGSPFPVFPAQPVKLSPTCTLSFVDGGYAHLEPVEAAAKLGARQVLIVRSQPDPRRLLEAQGPLEPAPFPSKLLERTGRILPFLYGRSQEIDRHSMGSLVVVALTPWAGNGKYPFLTDFRPTVVRRMIRFATADVRRPIGTIEALGLPRLVGRIQP